MLTTTYWLKSRTGSLARAGSIVALSDNMCQGRSPHADTGAGGRLGWRRIACTGERLFEIGCSRDLETKILLGSRSGIAAIPRWSGETNCSSEGTRLRVLRRLAGTPARRQPTVQHKCALPRNANRSRGTT
jgi:hypothetical protein